MTSDDLKEWSAQELVSELRRRQRERSAGGERAVGQRERLAPGRARKLQNVPSEELVNAARERQRAIYGVDDRKDLYQVTKKLPKQAAESVVALVEADDLTADGN